MPINFIPRGRTAFDEATGITISHPRMYPEIKSDGTVVADYEYTFYRNGEIIDGLATQGIEKITEISGNREYTYTLEITNRNTVERLIKLKLRIGNKDSDFEFISGIAQGMINVFANNGGSIFTQRNLVTTTLGTLLRNGIAIPAYAHTSPDGTIILAELHVPANSVQNPQP